MKIAQLYDKYQIMPQLITHQLRVGAIVRLISNDRDSVITALLHDMGNLAKFSNLDPYWSEVQKKFWEKYGKDANSATLTILKELGLDKYHDYMLEEVKFYDEIAILKNFDLVSKPALLTLYADSRVAMNGVVSMEERIIDLEKRYGKKRDDRIWASKLEDYVQTLTPIAIKEISEEFVTPLFPELLGYNIEV